MRLLHVSDNHSILYPLKEIETCDVVVHSGDFLPNTRSVHTSGSLGAEKAFQKSWVIRNIPQLKDWLQGKPFLLTPGNHDFIDPCEIMRQEGIDARNLTENIVTFGDTRFYGFPYIPWMGGGWNFEEFPPAMIEKVDKLVRQANDELFDVIVAHCPPFGIMDKNHWGQNCGNQAMMRALEGKFSFWPKAYLCGHIHESHGMGYLESPSSTEEKMLISNAATTQRIIEL